MNEHLTEATFYSKIVTLDIIFLLMPRRMIEQQAISLGVLNVVEEDDDHS